MKNLINAYTGNKIPYTLVSMAAILRDYADMSDWYKNDLHEKLTDIADSLYNVGITPDEFKTEYKELYDQYGKAYFDKVLDDMYALDGQLTSDDKVQELFDDYADRLDGVKASTKVTASRHWREKTECKTKNGKITRMQNISSIFNDVDYYILYDANGKFVEKSIDFNYLHDKLYDVGKDDSQPSPAAKFLKGHPLSIADVEGLWDILPMYVDFGDSDALLQENGYTLDQASEFLRQGYSIYVDASTKVTAATNYDTKLIAKWLKAKFDDEAFGTAYTMHRISDADAYMSRNGLTYNRKNKTIDLWKSGGDEDIPVYKVIPQYSSTKRQGTYAPKMPKLVPIDEWNAAHGVTASTRVTATEDNVTTIYGDYDTTLTIDMWYGDKFVPRKYGADASFYGNDGEYRGNIYNESGKIIGDYTSDNSVLIEKNFLIDFGE